MDASFTTLDIVLPVALAIVWGAAIIRRIYRLARYFQLEGYDSKRYLRWFVHQRREWLYSAGVVALPVLGVLLDMALGRLGFLIQQPGYLQTMGVGGALIPLILLLVQPHDRQVKQPFVPTQRATRLLGVAILVGISVPIRNVIGALFEHPESFAHFIKITDGYFTAPLALFLAPLMLPLANLLLWPLEESMRRYYMRMAKAHLKRSGARVICITGSYGKTSTKHYLQHIVSARFRTLMTPKSFNTLMGISRVMNETLAGNASYDYFIVEADAYFVGENASICRLVEPEIGMVMTVGPMHLERLGNMENIATAQYEIIASLPPHGAGIFNGDDPQVRAMFERGYPQTRLMVTQKGIPGARIEAKNVQTRADGLHFEVCDHQTGDNAEFYAPLYGETNVTNILMATAVAVHLGMSLNDIAGRVVTLQPAEHRLVRRQLPDGTVVIDDAYSANPVGTATALDVLKLHEAAQHRIVISSGMFELGQVSEQENRELGRRMAEAATDVILIGPKQTAPVKAGLLDKQFPESRLHVVENLDQAIATYRGILQPGDALLMLTDLPDTYAS